MKIIKFGGKSLANGQGISNAIDIIVQKYLNNEKFLLVVSARGNSTDDLAELLVQAKNQNDYQVKLEQFKQYQIEGIEANFLDVEFTELETQLQKVALSAEFNEKIKDQILSIGEIISAKYVAYLLNLKGIQAKFSDARKFIISDSQFGNAHPIDELSKIKTQQFFTENQEYLLVVPGFIGANEKGETTTLGRNGSNFSASLLANYLDVEEFQNYTHVDGIYTANPDWVADAQKVDQLSYSEANELANFGANILHGKTIIPLIEKDIPLRILNTFNPKSSGTMISSESKNKGVKSISAQNNVALIKLEGRGLLGRSDIDFRVFSVMSKNDISVSIISQGASERGVGFVISAEDAETAVDALKVEFEEEIFNKDISEINADLDVSVISIVGQNLSSFDRPFNSLVKNGIVPIIFSNSISGNNVSLIVRKHEFLKGINVLHSQIFGVTKKINIAIFGYGLVGGTLIDQILESAEKIENKKEIRLNIFAIANSRKVLLNKQGIGNDWKSKLETEGIEYKIEDLIAYADENHLENLIAVDNTASKSFVENYVDLVQAGFDLVSSNKLANTLSYDFYKELRKVLAENQKEYLYETNVGAGLPLIDFIKLLHLSGENITQIKGVFSGSLSYIFNHFSVEERSFHEVLQEAISKGFTEPDPREDLSGHDVARKLLILARELELENEFDEIKIQSLIPEDLQQISTDSFLDKLNFLDENFVEIKQNQLENHVLRYVGELSGNLQESKGNLEVKLVSVPVNSPLGQLKGSDSLFEIYTESYGDHPIVIQGAGAGASVTARGVFGDILRIVNAGNL